MFEHSAISLIPGLTILGGVVLLMASVLHALLLWLAIALLGLGVALLLADCVATLLLASRPGIFSVAATDESVKES